MPHTAYVDPRSPAGGKQRESIEVRALGEEGIGIVVGTPLMRINYFVSRDFYPVVETGLRRITS